VADNVFAYSPVEATLERRKPKSIFSTQQREKEKKPATAPRQDLLKPTEIAAATQVPPNIVAAFQEAVSAQVEDPTAAARVSQEFSTKLGQQLQQGAPMREAMSSLLGDDGDAIVDRALALNGQGGAQPGDDGDVFEGEGAGSLMKRRGQQFAAGAADAVAGTQDAAGRSQLEGARNMREQAGQRIDNARQQVEALKAELPNLPSDEERAYVQEQIGQLEAQIRQNQATETMGAETLPETAGFQRGQAVLDATESTLGAPDERDQSFWGQVARGAGNMTGMGVAGLPTAGAGAAVSGMGMNARQLYEEAKEAGADEAVAEQASKIGMTIGATEMIPLARALKILPPSFRKKITNGVMKRLIHIAKGSGEEAAQEYLATVANNVVAQKLYDPDRGWTENATEGALVGAVLGGGAGAVGSMRGGDADGGDMEGGRDGGPVNPKPAPTAPRNAGPNDEPAPGGEPPAPAPEPAPNDDLDGDALPEFPSAPEAPPAGPLSRAAERAGPSLSSGLTDGARVRITTPDGITMDAEFVEETADGLMLNSEDGPLLVSPDQIASGEIEITARDPIQERREEMQAAAVPDGIDPDEMEGLASDIMAEQDTPRDQAEAMAAEILQERMKGAAQRPPLDTTPLFADTGTSAGGNASTMAGRAPSGPVRLQKRPFTNLINSRLGGIDPDSEFARELNHIGVTPQSMPGLFRHGGAKEVDNLVAGDWGEYADIVGRDGEYLSRQGVIDAIAREAAGEPVQDQTQRDLQQEKEARQWSDEARAQGIDVDETGLIEADQNQINDFGLIIPHPEHDFATPDERVDTIGASLRQTEVEGGFSLTDAERAEAFDTLERDGGIVEDVLWRILEREVEDGPATADTRQDPDSAPPFGEQDIPRARQQQDAAEGAGNAGQSAGQQGREGGGRASVEDVGALGEQEAAARSEVTADDQSASATERTPEGDQSLIPGVTPVTDGDRAQAGTQRPMRGGQEAPPEGGLFDDGARAQDDMFAPEQTAKPTGKIHTTKDGYQDTRDADMTTVRDPDGRVIFQGEPDVDQEKVRAAIRKDRKRRRNEAKEKERGEGQEGEIEAAAAKTDPNPTPAQAEAENYKTGKTEWQGRTLSIENRKGSTRSKVGPDGKTAWEVEMPAHYGRILRTEGADGDHVDFYMGDNPDSESVWVVDQMDADTGRFDEHKVMLGFNDATQAAETYKAGFSDGKGQQRLGGIRKMSVPEFDAWLESDTKKPITPKAKRQDKEAATGRITTTDDRGPHYAAGRKAGESGEARELPSYFTNERGKNAKDWLAGYDEGSKAAATAPDQPTVPRVMVNLVGSDGKKAAERGEPQQKSARPDAAPQQEDAERDAPTPTTEPEAGQGEAVTQQEANSSHVEFATRRGLAIDDASGILDGASFQDFEMGEFRVWRETPPPAQDFARTVTVGGRKIPVAGIVWGVRDSVGRAGFSGIAYAVGSDGEAAAIKRARDLATKKNTGDPAPSQGSAAPEGMSGLTAEENAELAALEAELSGIMKNQTSSGLDPKLVELAYKIGRLYIRAGRRQFSDFIKALMDRAGLTFEQAQPVARNAYNQLRDDMDLDGQDVGDMQSSAEVMQIVRDMRDKQAAEPEPDRSQTGARPEPAAATRPESVRLAEHFQKRLGDGAEYSTIVAARKEASEFLGRDLSEADLKMVEEAMESGVVQAARDIVRTGKTEAQKFDELVALYKRQPKLAQRTSSSIQYQAYSTPAPMAYLASRLAGIDAQSSVYEPSAGTGMLLIEATPANVTANELQGSRSDLLQRLYSEGDIRQTDAMEDTPPNGQDAVIANPPFGKVKGEDGRNKEWAFEGSTGTTGEIDHAISMRALSAMKDDGRAVLIVGGHQGDADARKTGYRAPKRRAFWKKLYDNYNVTEHFTLDGDMYSRQGAGWPVDVVVIEGRGKSGKSLPMKEAPVLYNAWDQLKGRIDGQQDSLDPRGQRSADSGGSDAPPQQTTDRGTVSGSSEASVRPDGARDQGNGRRPVGDGAGADVQMGRPDAQQRPGDTGNAGEAVRNAQDAGAEPSSVPDQPGENQGRTGDAGTAQPDAVQRPSRGDLPDAVKPKDTRAKVERNNTEAETDFQVQYTPRSNAQFAVGTLVPKNVADSVGRALGSLEARVGDIDQFVARELDYDVDDMLGTPEKRGYFSAEQVDAIALAIDNVGDGLGFIIGDQTGVGKGRIVAGMIRYALRQGKTPVFFTVNPGLYGDMMRDLRDIGMGDIQSEVMVTNNSLRAGKAVPVSSKSGDTISSGTSAEQDAWIRAMLREGSLPEGKRVLFTTYDQMTTDKGNVTNRMRAMQSIAPNAMFILDESHEAGGTANAQPKKEGDPEPRSVFIRKLLAASPNGKMFSSATFAKNSAVMSLYTSTNLRNALPSAEKLEQAVEQGGVPMQQVISAALVQDGQYVRRERTYEGISMEMDVLSSDPIAAENGAKAVREIFKLDSGFMEGIREAYAEELMAEGSGAARDAAIGEAGASSTNFASTMHNVVAQLLLSVKTGEVADRAIDLFKQGKKPIIALSNTNASIVEDYINDRDLSVGDSLDVPFNEILRRYLDRLRRITIKDEDQNKSYYFLTDGDIERLGGRIALDEVRAAEKMIAEIDLGDLPGSPIDAIRDKMEAAGINVGEITGRSKQIRNGVLETRKNDQASKKRTMNGYNSGEYDGLIINRSGATGFSMHATDAADNDGKVRAMLILQPDNNIDVFMQMLGRINRTGQTKLPEYYISVSDLAVEKRPAALLMKKLASLNASTTANKKSAVTMEDAPDFMNKHGDKVVRQYLLDNPDVSVATGVAAPKTAGASGGIAAKLTGKLIVLGPKRTEEIYVDIEQAYKNYIDELDSIGANDLEAKVVEIDAKTESSQVIEEGVAPESAFGRDTILEAVDAKILGKPYTPEKLDELIAEARAGKSIDAHVDDQIEKMDRLYSDMIDANKKRREELVERQKQAKTEKQKDKVADLINRHDAATATQQDKFRAIKSAISQFAPGRPMMVSFLQNGQTQDTVYAMALGADLSRVSDNPTAASKISVRIALASPGRQITVSMSRLTDADADDYSITGAREETVRKAFENGQAEAREKREVVTGNVINAFSKFKGRGQIVMFRRDDGSLDQGLMLPKDFSAEQAMADAPRSFTSVDQAIKFVSEAGTSNAPALLKTADEVMTVQRTPGSRGEFEIRIDKKRGHKPYIFNPTVREILGDFSTRSGPFKKSIESRDVLGKVLSEYEMSLGSEFIADAHKNEAQAIIDADKPAPKASRREPVTSLTGKEIEPKGDGMRALRAAGIRWYRDNLVGKRITNRETGWEIGFTRRGAAKSVNAKGEDLVRLIPALEQVMTHGTLVSTMPDIYGRQQMKAVHKFAARVMLAGQPKDVVVTVREDSNGRMHYDLSKDMSVGARFSKKSTARRGETHIDPVLEVSPDTLNVAIAPEPVKRTVVEPAEVRGLKGRLRAELKRVGLSSRIKLRVSDGPIDADYPGMSALDGYFLDETIGVASDATGVGGAIGALRHEIIHALRDSSLWGGSHGLFTKAEWQTLVRAARSPANKHLRDKIKRLYPDLNATAQIEEVVAEMFREWGAKRDTATPVGRALAKLGDVIQAITKALRLSGADTAADVFGRINGGEVGGRGPDGPGGGGGMRASRRDPAHPANVEPVYDANAERGRKKLLGNIMTQAMAGMKTGDSANALALVPGRPLFTELGKNLPSAQKYLRLKEAMDTLRNERHGDTDEIAQKWRRLISGDKIWKRGDRPNNARMMDLMHDSTIAGQDPSKPYMSVVEARDSEILETHNPNSVAYKAAKARQNREIRRKADYARLREAFDSLPQEFQAMFRTVRDEYRKLAEQFEKAIEEQAAKAMTVAVRRAERAHEREIERIKDDGLDGAEKDQAIEEANAALSKAKLRTRLSKQARIAQLRKKFESNRIEGPYFPLSRFGDLYVTSRDESGKIVSFSKFEKVADQQEEAARMRREGYDVEVGVMSETNMRDMVDPGFVADVEGLLSEISADNTVMDAIWQRWLETLPDMSLRKNRMHRKGTPGYSGDAFRAFGTQMFHGAHQLARLKYSLDMSEALEVAADEARRSDDPVRDGLVVREMDRRHEYVMNPQGAAWAQGATSAAFVYYLGMTPAAALVNVSQTSVVGTPILGAFYGKGGIRKAARELTRAMADFTTGKGHAADSSRLTDDERAAMHDAYSRGVVDKSQSHDLAGVGETGVEYSATRTMIMEKVSWFFHHAERMNREVTFLAAYRMAKDKGLDREAAIQKAGDLTWKTHFDYQNTARPRLLQNDYMRVAMVFRNFQINMLWRLFRDTHQMMRGKTKSERQEAMAQLAGITGSMMFHAGVKGTWGYALITGLLGLFFSGGSDDVEEAMETALLNYLPKDAAGMILNGAPGYWAGIDLTNRIGMPELWFRKPWRELEGEEEYNYWIRQMLGAVPGIGENIWRGVSMVKDGEVWRGVEKMTPKFINDIMQTGRYWVEGAETYRGDPIIDEFRVGELLAQAVGFTPARLSERYDLNSRMKSRERRIMDERGDILAAVRKSRREGDGLTPAIVDLIVDFNSKHPTYPITVQTLKQSIRGGMRASQRNVQGAQLNPRLDYTIRSTTRDPIYD